MWNTDSFLSWCVGYVCVCVCACVCFMIVYCVYPTNNNNTNSNSNNIKNPKIQISKKNNTMERTQSEKGDRNAMDDFANPLNYFGYYLSGGDGVCTAVVTYFGCLPWLFVGCCHFVGYTNKRKLSIRFMITFEFLSPQPPIHILPSCSFFRVFFCCFALIFLTRCHELIHFVVCTSDISLN